MENCQSLLKISSREEPTTTNKFSPPKMAILTRIETRWRKKPNKLQWHNYSNPRQDFSTARFKPRGKIQRPTKNSNVLFLWAENECIRGISQVKRVDGPSSKKHYETQNPNFTKWDIPTTTGRRSHLWAGFGNLEWRSEWRFWFSGDWNWNLSRLTIKKSRWCITHFVRRRVGAWAHRTRVDKTFHMRGIKRNFFIKKVSKAC